MIFFQMFSAAKVYFFSNVQENNVFFIVFFKFI